MLQWNERPQDCANLFNPAFAGLLLHRSMVGSIDETAEGLDFASIFLVLPLVLHKQTRQRLPKRVTTHLPTWLQEQRDVVIDFGDRVAELVPATREAILFLSCRGLVQISPEGRCSPGEERFRRYLTQLRDASSELDDCCEKAHTVGRWLSTSGSPGTLYALMGVKP